MEGRMIQGQVKSGRKNKGWAEGGKGSKKGMKEEEREDGRIKWMEE